jgi:hypothetical protein
MRKHRQNGLRGLRMLLMQAWVQVSGPPKGGIPLGDTADYAMRFWYYAIELGRFRWSDVKSHIAQ